MKNKVTKKEIKKINKIANENQSKYKILVEDIYASYSYDVNYEFSIEEFTNKYGDIFKELFKYLLRKKMVKFYKNKNVFKLEYEGFDYISSLFIRNRNFRLSINSLAFTITTFFILNVYLKFIDIIIQLNPTETLKYNVYAIIGISVGMIAIIREITKFD